MRRTKKVLALLLAMVLAFSSLSLAGCGKKTKAPITLTVYSQRANYSGEQIGWMAKILLDKFNVKLKIVKEEQGIFTTRMESGNLGDILIFGDDNDKYLEAANKGMLLDWNQDNILSDYGQYIKKHMSKALQKNAGLTKSGKVYGFGYDVASSSKDHQAYFYGPYVRWDLFKQLGYPDVKTLEDWIPVLEQMKKICPKSDSGKETYGVSLFNDWDGDSVMFVKATAALYGYDEFGLGLYDCNNQTWQGNLDDGSMYLRFLKFYNQLYQKDLVDPDSLTQKYDGAQEDYIDGDAFFTLFDYLGSIQYNTKKHIKQNKAMYAYACDDQSTLCYGLNVYGSNSVWAIGANSQYPELCMKILNWMCTPEGRMTTEYGPKGVNWNYNSKKQPYFTALGLKCREDGKTEMTSGYTGTFKDGQNQMNCITWSLDAYNPETDGETYNYQNWTTYSATQKSTILDDWRKKVGKTTTFDYLDSHQHTIAPATTFSMEKRSDSLDVVWKQVTKVIKNYTWKAIYAKNDAQFNSIVKQMQKEANGYGYDKCCAFMQKQAAKRKALEDQVTGK